MHSHANQRNRQWLYEDIAALADSGTYCLPLHQTPATVRDRQVDITKQQVSAVAIFFKKKGLVTVRISCLRTSKVYLTLLPMGGADWPPFVSKANK
jgi:hypothetical protein